MTEDSFDHELADFPLQTAAVSTDHDWQIRWRDPQRVVLRYIKVQIPLVMFMFSDFTRIEQPWSMLRTAPDARTILFKQRDGRCPRRRSVQDLVIRLCEVEFAKVGNSLHVELLDRRILGGMPVARNFRVWGAQTYAGELEVRGKRQLSCEGCEAFPLALHTRSRIPGPDLPMMLGSLWRACCLDGVVNRDSADRGR